MRNMRIALSPPRQSRATQEPGLETAKRENKITLDYQHQHAIAGLKISAYAGATLMRTDFNATLIRPQGQAHQLETCTVLSPIHQRYTDYYIIHSHAVSLCV